MNCPHCKTPIDEHEANRCFRGWVAEVVMGWRVENGADGLPAHAFPSVSEHVYLLPDLGPQWYPDHDIAAAWEVVERLRQKHILLPIWELATLDFFPLAICRAALKAVQELA